MNRLLEAGFAGESVDRFDAHYNGREERVAPGATPGDWIWVLKRDGPGEEEEIAVRLSDSANNPDARMLGTRTPLGKALLTDSWRPIARDHARPFP